VFDRPPLASWCEFGALLRGPAWPSLSELNSFAGNAARAGNAVPEFIEQTPALLADGMHYEQRIAARGAIATRSGNWHDLLNALVWLRYPRLKAALNVRQVEEIALAGPKRRTRAQCALTHFDEAGVIVLLRDRALLARWDAHDWRGLFSHERDAWRDGRIGVQVFGHALLEHALRPGQLIVGKALAVVVSRCGDVEAGSAPDAALCAVADAIRSGAALRDPQELRPLPLSGIPGWHDGNEEAAFYDDAPCFRPLRSGRIYPPPLSASVAPGPGS
jgi:hypothetical protein